jgi:hypothetical protein
MWRLILNGTQGETQAIKEIIDRVDGKVKENVELSGGFTSLIQDIVSRPELPPTPNATDNQDKK